jgi:hypothetical protein
MSTTQPKRRFRTIGRLLLIDATCFVISLLFVGVGDLANRERLYLPLLMVCVIPLMIGFVCAAAHLTMAVDAPLEKGRWWKRLLTAGPFGPGWYFSSVRDRG